MSVVMDGEIGERECPSCHKMSKSIFCPKCGTCEWCHDNVNGQLECHRK